MRIPIDERFWVTGIHKSCEGSMQKGAIISLMQVFLAGKGIILLFYAII
jgi:hypothetical protein